MRQSVSNYIRLHLLRKEHFPVSLIFYFQEYVMKYKPADVLLSSFYSTEELSHSFHTSVRIKKEKRERDFFYKLILGMFDNLLLNHIFSLDKPSGAVESSCLLTSPCLSHICSLSPAQQPLFKEQLKLLTDI